MKSTITDVAKHAGVSIKTVSRVLNKEPNVAEKTRERVTTSAKALNYTPSLSARSLAGSRSYLLGLVYDNPSPNYVINLQLGATDACREYGYHIVIAPVDMHKGNSKAIVSDLIGRLSLDGIILTPPLSANADLIEYLNGDGRPFVLVAPSGQVEGQHVVKMDDTQAAYDMTRHLIDLGHEEIAYIVGNLSHSDSALRRTGFSKAMDEAGLAVNQDWVKSGDFSFQSGVEAAEQIFAGGNIPTAVFASNDDMAAGVISVAARQSIKVPEDLSVCGFDDTPLATTLVPQLTTIAQPIYEMGVEAANALIKRIDIATKMLDYKLVVRGSTAPPRSKTAPPRSKTAPPRSKTAPPRSTSRRGNKK